MSRRGFSLAEALIAMAIGSLLLMGACRFLPALQRHILRQGEQLALENELWQRVHAVGKHLQRAGYCRGACGGAGLELAAGETQAIRDTAIAHSALQWGKQQVWSAQVALACREQAPQGWRACLRIFGDGSLVLSSASGEVQVWQSGEVRGGQVRFSAHGWSDFCPLREASLCQMP